MCEPLSNTVPHCLWLSPGGLGLLLWLGIANLQLEHHFFLLLISSSALPLLNLLKVMRPAAPLQSMSFCPPLQYSPKPPHTSPEFVFPAYIALCPFILTLQSPNIFNQRENEPVFEPPLVSFAQRYTFVSYLFQSYHSSGVFIIISQVFCCSINS